MEQYLLPSLAMMGPTMNATAQIGQVTDGSVSTSGRLNTSEYRL